jgi:hypothetical protein
MFTLKSGLFLGGINELLSCTRLVRKDICSSKYEFIGQSPSQEFTVPDFLPTTLDLLTA